MAFVRTDLPDGGVNFTEQYGPVNAERFSAYHRLDLRVHRYFGFADNRLSLFVEVRNLYNRDNVRLYRYRVSSQPNGGSLVEREADTWLPILPSIGLSWEF
jgi:hypothetical protein